ncbi:MAG: histone deacetylase [Bacteroidota bacterium]
MLKVAFSEKYIYTLPDNHRFPIAKYILVKEQLIYEGTIEENQIFDPGLVEEDLILQIHDEDYWNKLKQLKLSHKEARRIGLPITEISVKRARNSVAGTVESTDNALEYGVGVNLAGGTHHAYRDRGEGFCALNDIAIASHYLLSRKLASKILVVDLDVHQGNGTAKIFEGDDRVFTFSMHGEHNYPLRKEVSDLDIALPLGTSDETYLQTLSYYLTKLFESVKPDFVFYQSGVDVLDADRLGKLALSKKGCKRRDEIVLGMCHQYQVPVVVTMGGGYTERLVDLVDAHCNTTRVATELYA